MKQAFLLTGAPGTGKTSLLKEILTQAKASAGGFYTEEIRTGSVRQGFEIITLDGKSATLAHTNIQSPYRVSKYGVDISALEEVAVPAIRKATRDSDIVVIDEIGKMELFSTSFQEAVIEAIESEKRVLGTIMLKAHPWADNIKHHSKVKVTIVTKTNRNQIAQQILQWLKSGEGK
jgi:nucleoside-triphosphatase